MNEGFIIIVAGVKKAGPMSDLATIRRRLEHVESTLETVDEHIDDEADSRALVRALGVLEQVAVDLEELDDDE